MKTPIAGCDCCDKVRPLYHGTAAGGIETWACYECHGWDADPYADEIDMIECPHCDGGYCYSGPDPDFDVRWTCEDCHGSGAIKPVPSMCEPPDEQRRQAEERRRLDDVASRSGDEIIAKQQPGIRPDSGGEWNFKRDKMGWA